MKGFVWIVGGGPGDPDLLTRKAARVLQEVDLVLYDALVSREVLDLAPRAQRFFVGKRAGRAAVDQDTIHRLLIRAARRGRRVARLKGGDPFVFGRGGEEALALAAAGVPFEVVPGVSSALAAPALAGIPVTHRGLATGFLVVSGHAPSAYAPALDALPPLAVTLVVLMGLAARRELVPFLLARGWPADTPAAVVHAETSGPSAAWIGTLDGLPAATLPGPDAPGTIVIGSVVSLAEAITGFGKDVATAAAVSGSAWRS